MEFTQKRIVWAAVLAVAFGIIVNLTYMGTPLGFLSLIIAGLGALGGAALLKYGYLIIPWFTQRGNIVQITDTGYEIPPSQDVMVKKKGDVYYASVFIGLRIFESSLEKTEAQIAAYNKYFERAMIQFKKVVKIAYVMHAIDVTTKRKELEAKKAEAQLRLQREREKPEPDVLVLERLEREVAYWSTQLQRLTAGLRPMRVVMYAMVTEAGLTKEEAIAKAKAAGRELITLLSNSLNVDADFLVADEMLRVVEWEYLLPVTPKELEEQTEPMRRMI